MKSFKQLISLLLITHLGLCVHNAQAVVINDDAPNFTLNSLQDQQPITLAQFKGKVVYLDFWASWCHPCRQSFPFLAQLQQQYQQDGFEVVSVNLDNNPKLATDFLKQFPVNFTHLQGFDTGISEKYAIEAMPSAFFIDAKGRVRLIHKGFKASHKKFIKAVLEKLLAEN
ncbi:TlpA disulfide reductase family protein [uncultured Paraglaciecola sp.]|uniref:TlpA family protein disulfide reductase n=1 Tax=uncultured Paraglaciecola sp. TaxID=1765024 RepID=UPI0030D8B964|tara:strand:- start:181941 stop:182450 length:510 start_codon:yes stop_codon:yes gene_type:complete